MPYRKEQFSNGEIYHVTLRGIDGKLLFKNIDDYYRGIFSIYEFNNNKSVELLKRRRDRIRMKSRLKQLDSSVGRRVSAQTDTRDKFVEILAFCIMPNHIHLLVRQMKDGGIIKFMKKLGGGYARYFNLKYSRKGYVFQQRFSAVRVKTDEQLKIVFTYIHTNPISLIEPKWKEKNINNLKKVATFITFIKTYKWSSCSDYLANANFPSVTEREFLSETFGGVKICERFIENYIKYWGKVRECEESSGLFLE